MIESNYEKYMLIALSEARQSLREGNKGFGAVIIKDDRILTQTHDTDNTDNDPTCHAELKAIKAASKIIGKNLFGCIMFSTHEPCPMCSGAIIWSRLSELVYSISIKDSLKLGRNMIDISFRDILNRSPFEVKVTEGILKDECINLYREDVREHVKRFRNTNDSDWKILENDLIKKRLNWCENNKGIIDTFQGDDLEKAYQLLCYKLEINPEEAPVIEKNNNKIVFHSMNFCPSLEACKILDIDTKEMCKKIYEKPTDLLIKIINPNLRFGRNYNCLRPGSNYCEEFISLENG